MKLWRFSFWYFNNNFGSMVSLPFPPVILVSGHDLLSSGGVVIPAAALLVPQSSFTLELHGPAAILRQKSCIVTTSVVTRSVERFQLLFKPRAVSVLKDCTVCVCVPPSCEGFSDYSLQKDAVSLPTSCLAAIPTL